MTNGKFVLHHTKQRKGHAIYVYYMIAWYYRKNNKPIRHIIKHLGRLTHEEIDFYKKSLACVNNVSHIYPCNVKQLCVRESKEYLSCAIGVHFWEQWRLSSVFADHDTASQAEVSCANIAKILTIIRYVRPCSKHLSTELYRETCLPQLIGVSEGSYNTTRVFRELTVIEQHREALGQHIFTWALQRGDTDGDVVFYDLSSGNITGLRCVMAKWGHCKDGYQTHVVLLLVITREGYPIYWDVLDGNTVEVRTLEGVIDKIEHLYGRLNSVLCFDRGIVSDENLQLLAGKQIHFVTALDGSQLGHFEAVLECDVFRQARELDVNTQRSDIRSVLTQHQFRDARRNLFYKPLEFTEKQQRTIEKKTSKLHLESRRYFVAFNPELADITQRHRQQRVNAFFEWVESYNHELGQALGNRNETTVEKTVKKELKRRRLTDVPIEYELHPYTVENRNRHGTIKRATTYSVTVKDVSSQDYERSRKYDGVWILVTNMSPQEESALFQQTELESYFDIYRLKQKIEESFRILSNFVGIEPFHVYKSSHIKAHFTICMLSYLLDITILTSIRNSEEMDNMDLHRLFHILSKCKQDCIQLDDTTVVSKLTRLTDEQRKILKVLDCDYLVSPEHLQTHHIVSDYEKRA